MPARPENSCKEPAYLFTICGWLIWGLRSREAVFSSSCFFRGRLSRAASAGVHHRGQIYHTNTTCTHTTLFFPYTMQITHTELLKYSLYRNIIYTIGTTAKRYCRKGRKGVDWGRDLLLHIQSVKSSGILITQRLKKNNKKVKKKMFTKFTNFNWQKFEQWPADYYSLCILVSSKFLTKLYL